MLECFTLDIDYSCNFCKGNYFSFIFPLHTYKNILDMDHLIKKIFNITLQLRGFDIMIHFNDHGIEKDKAYIIQLLILMGKFHIHKMKWSDSNPNFSYFKNYFKLYCSVLCNCTSKKAIRA